MVDTMTVNSQKGFTLVELMIGMTISLIIMAGAVYVFTQLSSVSLYETRAAKAQAQLRDVLSHMANDIRRAGYQGHELQRLNIDNDIKTNIFDATSAALSTAVSEHGFTLPNSWAASDLPNGTSLHVSNYQLGSSNCVLYAYNYSSSGEATSNDLNASYHLVGFRWVDGGQVEYVKTISGADSFECDQGTWEGVTSWDSSKDNGEVKITNLRFTSSEGELEEEDTGLKINWRSVTIDIAGESKATDGSTMTTSLSRTVKLPNLSLGES